MTEHRKASAARTVSVLAALAACVALTACGPHGPRGDRGLPPPPENVAYPSLSSTPPDARRPLKSKAEQQRLQADLLARKRQSR